MSVRIRELVVAAALSLTLGSVGLGFRLAKGQPRQALAATTVEQAGETEPVAQVQVALIKKGTIASHLTIYGTVVAAKGKGRIFSLPFESLIRKVLAVPGQEVQAGTPLCELAPSSPASLQMALARAELSSAQQELDLLHQQVKLNMTTRQQVLQAEKSLKAAWFKLRSLEQQGAGKPQLIRAPSAGVLTRVMIQAGQLVPAGGPLLETIGPGDLEVRLGVERENVGHLRIGQPVRLWAINDGTEHVVAGRVRLITRQLDPQTRLVNVYVVPNQADQRLWLNEYVKGQLTLASGEGLWVPPAAALPRQDGSHEVFTVKDGRAVRCLVRLGLENPTQVQVEGAGLAEGQPVIVVGNSQVGDGMAVKSEKMR